MSGDHYSFIQDFTALRKKLVMTQQDVANDFEKRFGVKVTQKRISKLESGLLTKDEAQDMKNTIEKWILEVDSHEVFTFIVFAFIGFVKENSLIQYCVIPICTFFFFNLLGTFF